MGIPSAGAPDAATVVSGGAITSQTTGVAVRAYLRFNVSVWGTFVASWSLERSFDGGTTWLNASANALGMANAFTAPASVVCNEPESGVLYRVNVTGFTSGTLNWRISK